MVNSENFVKGLRLTVILSFVVCQAWSQVSFTSSNLPIIVINTNSQTIVDEPKITADMGIIDNGPGQRNNLTDLFNNYNGKIGIELRGSTSQAFFPKKQYGIELRDGTGASIDAPLLGLPKKDDWVLFAPYDDKSLMRDVLAYKLGRDLGRYASRFRYCEVVLNGNYDGVYVLLEKVKRDKNRVDINKLDVTEISGDNLTGGYIVKLDKTSGSGGEGWYSTFPPPNRTGSQLTYIQYEYPKQDVITVEQKQYIQSYINEFETNLSGNNFKDPLLGYQNYIDVDAFIDYFIANEVSRNPDAYRLSTFMYKKKETDGGKLWMGPIWDFNLGFGNVNYCIKEKPEGFVIHYNHICPDDGWLIPFWWDRLFEDETFRDRVTARWQNLRATGPYQTSKIMDFVDSVATVLNVESQQRNFERWPVLGQWVWPNAYVGQTFQEEVDWLKDWLSQRLVWLDANIPNIVTAVEKPNSNFLFTISPNPFTGRTTLHYEIDKPGQLSVELIDLSGHQIHTFQKYHAERGQYDADFLPEHLPPGMYIAKIFFGGERKIEKLIKY